jgi:acyl-CoA reductase-like NAD-dependent aldehyde dehydrogenase
VPTRCATALRAASRCGEELEIARPVPPTTDPLYSPVDGTLVAEVADASQADVDRAAAAAREAFYAEWKFCGIERKRALFAKLKEALYAMANELAAAKVQPKGGAGIPPLGALLSAVPALVAGNTVVLKAPDQEAPQALKAMQAFHKAGFPAGVVNALSGKGPEVGQALVAHPATRLISFTGSTATGKKIMASAAEDLRRVQLNLGNKTAQIVFPDADLEAAARATVGSAFPGQACSAISRVLLHKSVRVEFIALLKEKVQTAGPSMVIDKTAVERVEHYVEMGKTQGSLLFGGARPSLRRDGAGTLFRIQNGVDFLKRITMNTVLPLRFSLESIILSQ